MEEKFNRWFRLTEHSDEKNVSKVGGNLENEIPLYCFEIVFERIQLCWLKVG
jgi:hypothetical protein